MNDQVTASDSLLVEINYRLALATWFGGLNLMRILLKFADSLNFKRVGKVTVFTRFPVATRLAN